MVRHYSMALIFMLVIVTALVPAGFVLASSDAPAAHGEHVAASAHGARRPLLRLRPRRPGGSGRCRCSSSLLSWAFSRSSAAWAAGCCSCRSWADFFRSTLIFVREAPVFLSLSQARSLPAGLLKRGPREPSAGVSRCYYRFVGRDRRRDDRPRLKPDVVNTLLGGTILFIVAIMITAKKSDFPNVPKPDALSQSLNIMGIYREESLGKDVSSTSTRRPAAWRCSSSSASWPACSAWARDGRTCRC